MNKYLISLALLSVIFISACINNAGILQGHIDIGPICPVEQVPPAPQCIPTAKTYDAYPVFLIGQGYTYKISPDKNGNYIVQLPAGDYIIRSGKNTTIGGFAPINVHIVAGKTTDQSVSIDTGIR